METGETTWDEPAEVTAARETPGSEAADEIGYTDESKQPGPDPQLEPQPALEPEPESVPALMVQRVLPTQGSPIVLHYRSSQIAERW